MVTISDRKTGVDENGDAVIDYYKAEVLTAQDYYAFGMMMPGRTYSNAGAKYKYGFNGKENDNEVKGDGNQQDYGMRIYDPRLGRFLSVDPLYKEYPWYTPYQFAGNKPIQSVDVDGAEENSPSTYVYKPPVLSLQKKDPIQEKVNAIKKQYNKIIWDARSIGANVAAENLQHFLNGSGTNRVLAASWIRSFGSISSGEDRIKGYYVERNVPQWASGMKEDQSVTKSDHWVADISNYSPFSELSYASGASKITANGSFNLSKKGNNIAVSGTVTMNWNDPYDWHAGLNFYIPGTGSIGDDDALFVQEHGGAKPFGMQSAWSYTFSGTYNSKTGDWSDVKWTYDGQVASSSSSGTTTQGNQQSSSMRDNRREYRRDRDQRRTRENTRRD
jgi:RHS repeat-associated protein